MHRFIRTAFLFFLALFALVPMALPKDSPSYSTPPKGSPLRKELLDTIRQPAEEYFGQKVIFIVETLRATSDWALFVGKATQPNGKPIDYRTVPIFRKNPNELNFDMVYGGVFALLKREGAGWKIISIGYDPSDVAWLDYDTRYHAPRALVQDPVGN